MLCARLRRSRGKRPRDGGAAGWCVGPRRVHSARAAQASCSRATGSASAERWAREPPVHDDRTGSTRKRRAARSARLLDRCASRMGVGERAPRSRAVSRRRDLGWRRRDEEVAGTHRADEAPAPLVALGDQAPAACWPWAGRGARRGFFREQSATPARAGLHEGAFSLSEPWFVVDARSGPHRGSPCNAASAQASHSSPASTTGVPQPSSQVGKVTGCDGFS